MEISEDFDNLIADIAINVVDELVEQGLVKTALTLTIGLNFIFKMQ